MTGTELIRKITRLGSKRGIAVAFISRRGNGSHGTLVYGSRFTVVRNPKDELKKGALHGILRQLGIRLTDL